MNRYAEAYNETLNEISRLEGQYERFMNHPTLHTRAPSVQDRIEKLKNNLSNLNGTAKLVDEMYK